jgi:hypothetical protein
MTNIQPRIDQSQIAMKFRTPLPVDLTFLAVFSALALVPTLSAADDIVTIPDTPKPGYLQTIIDPTFGNKVTRITGDPDTAIDFADPDSSGTWNAVARHQYSKTPAWNADQSLLFLGRNDGFPSAMFLDGTDFTPQFGRNAHLWPGQELRWHPTQSDEMVYVNAAEKTIGLWNVHSQQTQVIETFTDYTDLGIGPYEGNVSNDGRRVVINAKRDGQNVAFAYDLQSQKKYADIDLSGMVPYAGTDGLDWASISASGNYVVVNGKFNNDNTYGDQTQVYDLDGNKVSDLWSNYGEPSHFDLTLDTAGEDVAVGVSKSGNSDGRVIKRRLSDGEITVLTEGGYASHTSTRNIDRPGWAYVTYEYEGPQYPPYWGEVVAVKLDGSMTVERIAHLHAAGGDYLGQPQAVVSPDGSMVLWASRWNDPDGPIGTYVAEVPVPEPGSLILTCLMSGLCLRRPRR